MTKSTVTKVTEYRYTNVCPGFITEVLFNLHASHGKLIVESIMLNEDRTFNISIGVVEQNEEDLEIYDE